jgi:methionine salvage enolase-phosphatase E1
MRLDRNAKKRYKKELIRYESEKGIELYVYSLPSTAALELVIDHIKYKGKAIYDLHETETRI